MIALRDVTVLFGRTVALDGITVELPEGIVGLFGPNGSGKTTLLRVLSGLLPPTSGTASLGGTAIDASDEDFRRSVAYAGHEPGLYRHLTVGENLALFARLQGADPARIDEVLDATGIADRRAVRAGDLSAGLKRRAGVARALLAEPRLLLLDEPYANLDDEAALQMSTAIAEARRPGRCIVVATHGAKRLKPLADLSVVLRRGRLAAAREPGDHAPVRT